MGVCVKKCFALPRPLREGVVLVLRIEDGIPVTPLALLDEGGHVRRSDVDSRIRHRRELVQPIPDVSPEYLFPVLVEHLRPPGFVRVGQSQLQEIGRHRVHIRQAGHFPAHRAQPELEFVLRNGVITAGLLVVELLDELPTEQLLVFVFVYFGQVVPLVPDFVY